MIEHTHAYFGGGVWVDKAALMEKRRNDDLEQAAFQKMKTEFLRRECLEFVRQCAFAKEVFND